MALFVAIALIGLIIGSFVNVVVYRVPRRESVVLPASHCPVCEHPLSVWDNVPVFSYLLLRGRCRHCGTRISLKYPLVEIASSVVFVASYAAYGLSINFALNAFFLLTLLMVSVIDIEHKIIPNVIVVPAIAIGAVVLGSLSIVAGGEVALIDRGGFAGPAIGFLGGGGFLLLLAWLWPNGMGGGDIKLAALMGLFLGRYVVIAIFIGFFLGALGGVLAMSLLGMSRKDQIPFGPYLAVGAVLTLFIGVPLSSWYLGMLS